ncbi:hypothetical protein [Mycolicibacillus parakoreensis]|uniref:Lysoplasmalogenase n=1 Tax=Mycolicibacillus parakoreensis TaxID=1069221 RepID=A0ABY3U146_9MYCO|nr:hypothetical protein [Mycolicibacillus parakoreensis]ULN52603.1 hypothetical protein MIU77_17495 [Mycolicibacillus parakoreensis]
MVAAFPTLPRGPAAVRAGWLAREIVVGAGAVALIVTSAELRLPIGVPGHRGLIWLTLLVAVAATSRARTTVLAVGAASAIGLPAVGGAPGHGGRYVLAAALLYVLTDLAAVRRRPWLLALAAAPIHLLAVGASTGLLGAAGIATKIGGHLGFGLGAGALGLLTAARPGHTSAGSAGSPPGSAGSTGTAPARWPGSPDRSPPRPRR